MIVLWIAQAIFTIVLALFALVIAALSVPVACRVRSIPESTVRTEVIWLFGVVRVRLDGKAPWQTSADDRRKRREKRARKGRDTKPKAGRRLPPGGGKELIALTRPILRTVGGIIHRFRVTGEGDLFFGLSDPADTGRLWGQGYPLFSRLSAATGVGIHPVFDGQTLRLEGSVAIRTVPITLTFPVLGFLASRDGRRLLRLIRRSR
jgi:hypothetical protein